jgi:hypothetical protein
VQRRIARLLRLQQTLGRLQDVLAARIAGLQEERRQLIARQKAIEALMAGDARFLDLTTGGALRRIREIAARLSVVDSEEAKFRKRSADAWLKAKRAGEQALGLRRDMTKLAARRALDELADRLSPASLPQAKEP